MRYIEQNNCEYRLYDDLEDMLTMANQARYVASLDSSRSANFTGRRDLGSWDGVVQASRREWPEGLSVVDRMLSNLGEANLPKPKSRRRRLRWDESNGDEICYDRLRSGQPFWRESRRQVTSGPTTVTILTDVCTMCGVDAGEILWRGAAAIVLAKLLEEADYRVELWAYEKCNQRYDNAMAGMNAVCLKRPQDPLDTSTLVSSVSGWFYRTVFFRVPSLSRRYLDMSLGPVVQAQSSDLDLITNDERRIVVERIFSHESAIGFIKQSLRNMNLVKECEI